jgi:hypothetical protein
MPIQNPHPVFVELTRDIETTKGGVIMFDGYSGAGYENPEIVKNEIKRQIMQFAQETKAMKFHGAQEVFDGTIYVVAGATKQGIGMVYEVAEELKQRCLKIKTVGIVSELASKKYPDDIAKNLDFLVDIADPNETWQVLDEKGKSYMVDVIKHSEARACFMGGGLVAKSELEEIHSYLKAREEAVEEAVVALWHRLGYHNNITVSIQRDGAFAPKQDAMLARIKKMEDAGKTVDPYQFNGTMDFPTGVTFNSLFTTGEIEAEQENVKKM